MPKSIFSRQDMVHLIVSKYSFRPRRIGDGQYGARRAVFILSCPAVLRRLIDFPSIAVIGIDLCVPKRIHHGEHTVHPVIIIAPDVSFRVLHLRDNRPVVGKFRRLAVCVRDGYQTAQLIIGIAPGIPLPACPRQEIAFFIVCKDRSVPLKVFCSQRQIHRIISILRPCSVRSCDSQYISVRVIGIGGCIALLVCLLGDAAVTVGLRTCCSVRIRDFRGSVTAVILIAGHKTAVVGQYRRSV